MQKENSEVSKKQIRFEALTLNAFLEIFSLAASFWVIVSIGFVGFFPFAVYLGWIFDCSYYVISTTHEGVYYLVMYYWILYGFIFGIGALISLLIPFYTFDICVYFFKLLNLSRSHPESEDSSPEKNM